MPLTTIQSHHLARLPTVAIWRWKARLNGEKGSQSALWLAVTGQHVKIVETLLEHGADVEAKGVGSSTPLLKAVVRENYAIIAMLLDRRACAEAALPGSQYRALHVACSAECENVEVVRSLLERGAQFNSYASEGRTMPLHLAVERGHCAITRLLLDNGADINARGATISRSPLQLAVASELAAPTDLPLDRHADTEILVLGSEHRVLHTACNTNKENVTIVKLLLAGGAQVNASGPDESKTSLYFAIKRDYYETAKTLLDHGTDVDAIDADVQRPLYMAVSRKQLETVELLLDQNANIKAVGHEERRALHYACFGAADNLPLLRLLLEHRADVEARGPRNKKTSLHFAVMKGYYKTAKCL